MVKLNKIEIEIEIDEELNLIFGQINKIIYFTSKFDNTFFHINRTFGSFRTHVISQNVNHFILGVPGFLGLIHQQHGKQFVLWFGKWVVNSMPTKVNHVRA